MSNATSDASAALRDSIVSGKRSFNKSLFFWMLVALAGIFAAIVVRHAMRSRGRTQLILELGQALPNGGPSTSVTLSPEQRRFLAEGIEKLSDEPEEPDIPIADLLRDFFIAIFIAASVAFVIERYANDQLRRDITYDVLSAAYGKVVPEKIYTQVADTVFRSDVFREDWEVQIEAEAEEMYPALGIAIITSTISYSIRNLNDQRIPFEVSGAIDLDVLSPPHLNLPMFKSIMVFGSADQPLAKAQDVETLLKAPPGSGASKQVGNLSMQRTNQELSFCVQIHIPANDTVKAAFQVRRAIRVPGTYVLHATTPAAGIEIKTDVKGFKLSVIALHPNRQALNRSATNENVWKFDRGILPWQGFELRSETSAADAGSPA